MITNPAVYIQQRAPSAESLHNLPTAPSSRGRFSLDSSSSKEPSFYTYISFHEFNETFSAIIDFSSCCSVVSKKTANQAMHDRRTGRLKDEQSSQRKHLFGPSNKPMPTLCAVRVPFKGNIEQESRFVNFIFRTDVIKRRLFSSLVYSLYWQWRKTLALITKTFQLWYTRWSISFSWYVDHPI